MAHPRPLDEQLTEFDHNEAAGSASETRQLYAQMREQCPVAHSDKHGGFDVINRYDAVREALNNSEGFSSGQGVFIPPSGMPAIPPLEFDGAAHDAWRELMDPPLTPRAVRKLETTILEVADGLIDEFAHAGSADLVAQLAEPLPAIVIGRMVGLDQERSKQGRVLASDLFSSIGTPAFPEKMGAFAEFTEAQLEERRRHPQDDFLTEIASGEVGGMTIDSAGAAGLMVAYLVGGHHSTGSGIAGLLHHVLTEPGLQQSLLAEPKLIVRAVEESLRLNTPLQLFARTACEGAKVGEDEIESGRRVLLNLAAANRDPRQFDDAEQFDLRRSRNPHLAFGAGKHVCQGQHLARAELKITVSRILERFPDIRVDGDAQEIMVGGALMTMSSLPVVFKPET